MNILVKVPEGTIPYKCGERYMICDAVTDDEGKIKIEKCLEFFKDNQEALNRSAEVGALNYTTRLQVKAV